VTATPLAALELALNRLLALDAATLERLAALDGRLIVIESPTFGVALGVVAHRHGVQLMEAPQTADVRIRGRLSDLLRAPLPPHCVRRASTGRSCWRRCWAMS
jgi:ubiquinone biosynthesis protein UbiJ